MTEPLSHDVRRDVADVLLRYATCIDRRDWEGLRGCFTAECEADYGDIGSWRRADDLAEWMRQVHEPCGHTMHRITNVVVESAGAGRVAARCYVDALVLFADNQVGTRATGFYDDELVQEDGSWRIATRRFTMVLLQLVPDGTVVSLDGAAGAADTTFEPS